MLSFISETKLVDAIIQTFIQMFLYFIWTIISLYNFYEKLGQELNTPLKKDPSSLFLGGW